MRVPSVPFAAAAAAAATPSLPRPKNERMGWDNVCVPRPVVCVYPISAGPQNAGRHDRKITDTKQAQDEAHATDRLRDWGLCPQGRACSEIQARWRERLGELGSALSRWRVWGDAMHRFDTANAARLRGARRPIPAGPNTPCATSHVELWVRVGLDVVPA